MEDKVSAFIVGTCRVLPKSNVNKPVFGSMQLQDFKLTECYLFICGSCAEFFIQPLQSCIGDVDYLCMDQGSLVFTTKNIELPYDVRHSASIIHCFLIEPYSIYHAFVQLRYLGHMRYNWECRGYEFWQVKPQAVFYNPTIGCITDRDVVDEKNCVVGPSYRHRIFDKGPTLDYVYAKWCPQWPNEAKQWPFRQRNHGWPTTAIIHEVVQNGCHVVSAKHNLCRNDENQWRLSFSVAEVILLQSWTATQQIVYHMLRFLAKKELIKKNCQKEDEVLCTYHFKTLMLWACEDTSPEWWISSSVIAASCTLLEKLAKWLKEIRCQNYFIPEANLLHEHFNQKVVDETIEKLIHFSNSEILSLWFVEHYMQPSFLDVLRAKSTHEVLSSEHLLQTRQAMKANYPKSIDRYISIRFLVDFERVRETAKNESEDTFSDIFFNFNLRFGSPLGDQFDLVPASVYESSYWFHQSMLRILTAASLLDSKGQFHTFERWLPEVIRPISRKNRYCRSRYRNLPRPLNADVNVSQLYLTQAQDLMENLTASNDLEFQVLSEISKRLLAKAFQLDGYKANAMVSVTLSYMAALCFAASEYKTVVELCHRVIRVGTIAELTAHALNAGCLLFIDDIAKITGFYLIFLKTRSASVHYTKRPLFLDLRLTPAVFAHFLLDLSINRTIRFIAPNDISQFRAFPLDIILVALSYNKFVRNSPRRNHYALVYQRTDPMITAIIVESPNEDVVVPLLKQYSLSFMASFYNAIYTDFDINCSTVDYYRAAFLYERRTYSAVMDLCEKILDEPDLQTNMKEFAIANIMVLPPLDVYFDHDIQFLLGLYTLVCNVSKSNEDLRQIHVEDTDISTSQNEFVRRIFSDEHSLSLVLLKPYSQKCHYFLGKHFLARYLKVRCLIDCNNLISEVMIEFSKLNGNLPFENIIRCFVEQKLRRLQKVGDVN